MAITKVFEELTDPIMMIISIMLIFWFLMLVVDDLDLIRQACMEVAKQKTPSFDLNMRAWLATKGIELRPLVLLCKILPGG